MKHIRTMNQAVLVLESFVKHANQIMTDTSDLSICDNRNRKRVVLPRVLNKALEEVKKELDIDGNMRTKMKETT